MLYSGKSFTLTRDGDVLELKFDSQAEKVNVFHKAALIEFGEALDTIEKESDVAGLVMTSGKSVFVAGADITEFLDYFEGPDSELRGMLDNVNGMFNRFEDLPFPTVCAINGEAQGGGFEVCLAADYRIASPNARVGLPEVKLGIMPGWGGSIRLPRLIGTDNAVEWMCTGIPRRAAAALEDGAVDGVVDAELLLPSALNLLEEVRLGKRDYLLRRARKKAPIGLSKMEATMAIESARGVVGAKAGPHYPSPMTIISTLEKNASKSRDEALPLESENFIKLAKTDVAECLVGIFLKDSLLKRIARKQSNEADPVKQSAVLGAGIMGGGVAYQSASNGVPIVMKDIRSEAIDAGLEEVGKLLKKQLQRGKIKPEGMADVLNAIQPALSYGEFEQVDLVVEAVVENPDIKMAVLAEVEGEVTQDTIITTNTSTISVDLLSSALKRPENFCGMHFFNPVHLMPLVEVIRAKTSSDKAIATTVAYALAMKKTPIVVNDCPGFLVNRILFAYFGGFNKLVADGASVAAIDKAMERFGWPMGPAYLLDVVGLDTGKHAAAVMAEGFPDRMASDDKTVIDAMFEAERFGQKNGKGFYRYEIDRKGKPKKIADPEGDAVVASVQSQPLEIEVDAIVDRMMIPLCIESARCLEDGIVGTAAEVDMGLVYGIGFPPFRGGALQYIDKMGLDEFCRRADELAHLGPLYHPTDRLRKMMKFGQQFHGSKAAKAGAQA